MTRDKLYALALALALASIVLSVFFKGLFVFLLVPAFFAWNGARKDRTDKPG
jgi:uncharacterized protein YqhQ